MISHALVEAGYKTGLYISPFVVDFRERFQLNNRMIGKQEFADIITFIKPFVDTLDAQGHIITEFELVTAAAFVYFSRRECDYVVLEVGLGGRFDATNIIDEPACSVIAHIDLDHTQILGSTYAEIATEKCGIIKSGCPVISYPDQHSEALDVIRDTADKRGCELTVPTAASNIVSGIYGNRFTHGGTEFEVAMPGRHQVNNALTAISALRVLGISEGTIARGIARAAMPARLEVLSREPLIILDGAHNPDGMGSLAAAIVDLCDTKPVLITGMLADKEYEQALGLVAPLCKRIITLRVPNPRTLKASELAKTARKFCKDVTCARSYDAAIDLAAESSNGAPIIIAGSLYLAAAIRPRLLRKYKKS